MTNYSVYRHTSPNGKVYIGLTSTDPQKRWANGDGYKKNQHFYHAIQKYGWDNFDHDILFSGLTKEEAAETERKLITEHRSNESAYGYNLTSGGEIGKKHSAESIEKMRKAKIGMYDGEKNPRYGQHCSDHTKALISERLTGKLSGDKNPNYGKKMSEEQKAQLSIARTGKHYFKLSESVKNSPECIAVRERQKIKIEQYSKDGEFIKEWDSAPDAARALGGKTKAQCHICSCCNGKLKTAYGFVWKHKGKAKYEY